MDENVESGDESATKTTTDAVHFLGIDHIAIAVRDLEKAIVFYAKNLGFTLTRRLKVEGVRTGMISAEMEHRGIKFVLCQGTEAASQVSRLIDEYGPGVAHIAFLVNDVQAATRALRHQGMQFDTQVIEGPGLTQSFTARDPNSGLSFECISRGGEQGFLDGNVQELFNQMERSGSF